jgi:fructose-bisphosphate aldolase class II
MARELAERVPVSVALHTDHCPPALVDTFLEPLIVASEARVRAGADPLFNSHMFDGSTLQLARTWPRRRVFSSGAAGPG